MSPYCAGEGCIFLLCFTKVSNSFLQAFCSEQHHMRGQEPEQEFKRKAQMHAASQSTPQSPSPNHAEHNAGKLLFEGLRVMVSIAESLQLKKLLLQRYCDKLAKKHQQKRALLAGLCYDTPQYHMHRILHIYFVLQLQCSPADSMADVSYLAGQRQIFRGVKLL